MVVTGISTVYSLLIFAEKEAVWLIGDKHPARIIAKFIGNKFRYPELAVFDQCEYFFDEDLTMDKVPHQLADMFNVHDHLPQVVILLIGSNDLGTISKAQLRARAEDMITDVDALWAKTSPTPTMKLGLLISLVPPQLWYQGYTDQRAGRYARRSLNSHIGKISKLLKAVVIPHPTISGEEKWFSDPRANPWRLSEPGHDLVLQDICRVLAAKLQFSPLDHQREVALKYWHPTPDQPTPQQQSITSRKRKSAKGRAKSWRK